MIITWLGHSCFKLQDKSASEGATLVTDPFDKSIGKMPNVEADVVTISHDHHDHANISAVGGQPYIVKVAGEYDIKNILIQGIQAYHDDKSGAERGRNIIYRIEMEGVSVVHLGDLGHILGEEELEQLAGTDILLIPIGGKYTLDAKKAVEVISQIEPRIVIPMHYKMSGSDLDIDGLEPFIREIGIKPREEERLKVSKGDLPSEDMEVVVLKV